MSLPVPDSSALQGKDAVSLLEHLLPLIKQWEPELTQGGSIEECRLGALPGAVTTLRGKSRRGPYVPMPLTPLTGVQAGDNVVTLGFPSRDKLAGISLTITTGVVTRMNRGPDGKVVTIDTDAAITHGSSGGPCVSLVTGGVIGLNTFGTDVVLDRGAAHLNDLINYFGVVPIDHCLREFPLETDLRIPRDGSTLDWFDAYRLSRKYAEVGSPRVAARLAARVVALRPELPESHWLQALGKYVAGIELAKDEGADALLKELPNIVAGFEGVLRMDPESSATLLMLANIHVEIGKLREARAYADRATKANPDDWQAEHMRGRVALAEKELGLAIQCAARAKELSGSALAEPFLLAGQAHYANKAYDAGRAEYQSAVRLHPASLEAHLGVASFHDLQGRTEEAVGEYRRVLDEFPLNPVVLAAIGQAYYTAKRYPEATREYDAALQRFEQMSQTPPADMLYCMADALLQQKESATAAHVFSLFLSYYPNGEVASQVHLQSASIWMGAERHGLAGAHVRAAKMLTEDAKVKAQIDAMQLQPLSLEEIELLLKVRYPLDVTHLLIRLSPLTFAIQSEEDVKRLHGELGIPGPLIEAIIASNKEFGVQQGGVQPGGAQSLLGTWVTQGQMQDGTRYRFVVEYTKDRFKADTHVNGQLYASLAGGYKVENGVIVTRSDQGLQERYPFEFRGAQIFVQMPGVGTVAFDRAK